MSGRASGWTFTPDRRVAVMRVFAVVVVLLILSAARPAAAAGDPLEPLNRLSYHLNGFLTRAVVLPAGVFLRQSLPDGLVVAAGNVYTNLIEPEFILTNLLAGHRTDAGVSAGRFLINSTLGLAGLYDPAGQWFNLQRRETEFGEALCMAGVPPGPYLVLPLVGSTNAVGAALAGAFVAVEWAALGLASTIMVAVEQVLEVSVGAASVRHAGETVDPAARDGYLLQRTEFWEYVESGCRPNRKPQPAEGAQGQNRGQQVDPSTFRG